MNREKIDKLLNEISKSVVDKIISQFKGFVFHHGGFLKMDGDDPSHAFRKGEVAFLADTADEHLCRWPSCDCYSPQGPQVCRRTAKTETPKGKNDDA